MYRSYFFLFGSQRTYSAVKPGQCRFLLQLLSSHLRIEMRCYLAPSQRSLSIGYGEREALGSSSGQYSAGVGTNSLLDFLGSVGRRRCLGEGGRGGIPASSQLKSCGRWKRGERRGSSFTHSHSFASLKGGKKESNLLHTPRLYQGTGGGGGGPQQKRPVLLLVSQKHPCFAAFNRFFMTLPANVP